MGRKRWTPESEITPALLKFREKRKWQISLRRYVLEKNICFAYAPYFGLDIDNMRQWFEYQFPPGISWSDFAKKWQFDHIIPVTYFNYSDDNELKMCWNFTNIRVELFQRNKDRGNRIDVLGAKAYFKKLYDTTQYHIASKILQKIDTIEITEIASTKPQQDFIKEHQEYLAMIEGYTAFEFELLNSGRNINEVRKEIEFMKKIGR